MGAGRHARPVDTGRRISGQVDSALGQKQFFDGHAFGFEGAGQRGEPLGVLVDHKDSGLFGHPPSLGTDPPLRLPVSFRYARLCRGIPPLPPLPCRNRDRLSLNTSARQ
ncbi:hypothetical protein AX769_08065 [Frondihabitans sp. PAMC 28766]|nr:hypothetical protein AX769_08065 [Frondihabitans sp. PAMC 28766]